MFQFTSFLMLSLSVVILFSLVRYWRKSRVSIRHKLPPGPPKLPLVGNLYCFLGGSLPHHSLTDLAKKYGSVMHLQLGERFAVVLSSTEAVKEALKTKEISFAQRPEFLSVEITAPGQSSILFAPYGDYWRQVKKISVNELLSAKRVQSFRPIREEEVWNMVESISSLEGAAVNLSDRIFAMINNVTSRAAFGLKCKDQDEFLSLLGELLRLGATLPDLYPSLRFLRYITGIQPAVERIQKKLDRIVQDVVDEHRVRLGKHPRTDDEQDEHEDILDVLLKIQDSNNLDINLTNEHIKSVVKSSARTTEWAMAELLKNPKVMEKAQAEVRVAFRGKTKIEEADIHNLSYLRSVIKETLRLHPPGPLLPREAGEATEIKGYHIPAGAWVIINVWSIGRDPHVWMEPDCFKPERFQDSSVDFKGAHFELIPFGAGRRICPGISFATANIELALSQLLYHFDWKLPDGNKFEELDMSEFPGFTARMKHNLVVVPINFVPFTK